LPREAARSVEATVPVRVPSELGRKEFILVALVSGGDGVVAFPSPKGSGAITSFAQADGFVEVEALSAAIDAGSPARVTLIGQSTRVPDLVVMGSHCIALDVVLGRLAEQGFSTRLVSIGSQGGVAAARRGECDLAPVHLLDPASGDYNTHLAGAGLSLVRGWQRMQGIVYRAGDRRFDGATVEEGLARALADRECIMVNRNVGAGTRILIDRLLKGEKPAGYGNQPRSHNAVAAAVAQGRADWGVAVEPVARMYGLGFLPVAPESYDFLVVESRHSRPAVEAFLAALKEPAIAARIRGLGMQPAD
jgi:putative molybdopterin biosynthesis protein